MIEGLDELVSAVVRKLPAPGRAFPAEARDAWLKMMAMAFDVSYGPAAEVLPFPPLSVVADRHAGRPYNEGFTVGDPVKLAVGAAGASAAARANAAPRFYVAKDGRALRDPGAKPVKAGDVPSDEVIYDERPDGRRELDTIAWADGSWPAEALPPLTFASG